MTRNSITETSSWFLDDPQLVYQLLWFVSVIATRAFIVPEKFLGQICGDPHPIPQTFVSLASLLSLSSTENF